MQASTFVITRPTVEVSGAVIAFQVGLGSVNDDHGEACCVREEEPR